MVLEPTRTYMLKCNIDANTNHIHEGLQVRATGGSGSRSGRQDIDLAGPSMPTQTTSTRACRSVPHGWGYI